MSGILFTNPRFTPVNNAGTPRAGAVLYFYQAGTSTLANVYTTSDLSTPHTSPVEADAAGVFPAIYLDPSAGYDYKAICKTSATGSQVWSEDNIPATSTFRYPRTSAEIAAGVTPTDYSYEPGNVLRYGTNATPGTTDMTTAVQAAVDQYRTGGSPVYVAETFLHGVITVSGSLHIKGEGTLKGSSGSSFRITANIDHLILEGTTFTAHTYQLAAEGSGSFTADTTALTIGKVQATNCVFKDSSGGLFLNCVVENSIVQGCRFVNLTVTDAGIDTAGVWLGTNTYSAQDTMEKHIVTGNIFETITGNDETHGIIVYGREAIISNNVLSGVTNGALTDCEAIYTKCRYATISDNVLTDCDAGDNRGAIAVKGGQRGATGGGPQGYATKVHNNILITTSNSATCGIAIANEDVEVSGNYLEGFGLYGIYSFSNLSASNVVIRDNTIRKHRGTAAILTQHYGGTVIVEGNFIEELLANQTTIASAYGIQVALNSANTETVRVNHNLIADNATSAATTNLSGIRFQTGASGNIDVLEISNNTVNLVRASTTNLYGINFELRAAVNTLSMAENNCAGIPTTSNTYPIYGDTTTATYFASAKFDFRDNSGWGPLYDLNPSSVEWYHAGVTFTNVGASGTRTTQLPVATPGLWYSFVATDNHDLQIDPDGTEVIRGGTAGQMLSLNDQGESVTLRCFVAGTWEIVAGYGTYAYV